MDDLRALMLCAEAMDFDVHDAKGLVMAAVPVDRLKREAAPFPVERTIYSWFRYDPLHDDDQCMALVKRFGLTIIRNGDGAEAWSVGAMALDVSPHDVDDDDLNRAVVGCVANIELARAKEKAPT